MTEIHSVLAERTSPRSFDPAHTLLDAVALGLLEAARWAPSAMNRQPWRFALARRGTRLHAALLAALHEGNRRWAGDASALVVALAERSRDGRPIGSADYELGLAVAQLGVQAHTAGLAVHQMGGFDHAAVRDLLAAPEGVEPVVVVAVGRQAPADRLPPDLRTRELAPRGRRPLAESLLVWDDTVWPAVPEAAAPAPAA
jgi:nitroreductase